MPNRKKLVAGNWKMNGLRADGVALAGEHVSWREVEFVRALYAMHLIVLERRQDRNLAQLRKQLIGYLFDDIVLDDLSWLAHRVMGFTAFQRVARYWCTN